MKILQHLEQKNKTKNNDRLAQQSPSHDTELLG